jgi:predicted enzyme related to lactoylglutathione lyase
MSDDNYEPGVGAIARVEFYPKDPAAARKYFEKVFGWKIEKQSVNGMDLWLYDAANGPRGVMMASMGHVPPGTTAVFIRVESADATIEAAEAAGAKVIVPKYHHPGMGTFAWFESPGGVLPAVMQPEGKARK